MNIYKDYSFFGRVRFLKTFNKGIVNEWQFPTFLKRKAIRSFFRRITQKFLIKEL